MAPKKTTTSSAPPAAKAKPKAKSSAKQVSRSELVRAVFDTFDRDCDDLLNPLELRRFADSVGFEGDEQEWLQWYRDTCAEVGADKRIGVDRAQFMKLMQDAEDEDMYRLCGKRKPQDAIKHALTLRAVFDLFDRDCDCRLNSVELRRFMDNLDFEGDDVEWDDRYLRECRAIGADPQKGVDRSQFAEVTARSCTDEELETLLKELQALTQKPIALDIWSKLQPAARRPTVDDEADMKLEELVQSREPKPPERSSEGQIFAPEARAPASNFLQKSKNLQLDADEHELKSLRAELTSHMSSMKLNFPSLKAGTSVQ